MGLCGSKVETAVEEEQKLKPLKILFLGTGESGKSTFFKQLRNVYSTPFTEAERRDYRFMVYSYILTSIQTLCFQIDVFIKHKLIKSESEDGDEEETKDNGYKDEEFVTARKKIEESKKIMSELPGMGTTEDGDEEEKQSKFFIDKAMAKAIATVWKNKTIQFVYENRSLFQLGDSADYFFNKIEEIGELGSKYVPTESDVLKVRARSLGVAEFTFNMDKKHSCKIMDVGGQRNERKKWLHYFDNVNLVIFVVALNEYDQTLWEDEKVNRMKEALDQFEMIVNNKVFESIPIFLFLNKTDLFNQKIEKIPLTKGFPQYDGNPSFSDSMQYIRTQFLSRNKNPSKEIFCEPTCAMDRASVKIIWEKRVTKVLLPEQRATADKEPE